MTQSMDLSLGRRTAALALGVVFIGTLFVAVPIWLADLNGRLGWPSVHSDYLRGAAVGLFALGLAISLTCSRLFSVIGRGTPVPIAPPRELVVAGLYRRSRNPIFVADVLILLAFFLFTGHVSLLAYAVAIGLALHVFTVLVEEPGLDRRFGPPYREYQRHVPRWLGPASLRPWPATEKGA